MSSSVAQLRAIAQEAKTVEEAQTSQAIPAVRFPFWFQWKGLADCNLQKTSETLEGYSADKVTGDSIPLIGRDLAPTVLPVLDAVKTPASTEKMSKPRAPRAEKRSLVRWGGKCFFYQAFHLPKTCDYPQSGSTKTNNSIEDVNYKLLLAVQYECNRNRVQIPWDAVAKHVEDWCTGGALIQHLAKLRGRMVARGADVPPPLTRGGHPRGPAGPPAPKAASTKRTTARAITAKSGNTKPVKRKSIAMSEEADDDEGGYDFNSEAGYNSRTSKQSSNKNYGSGKIKKEESGDDVAIASTRGRSQRKATSMTTIKKGKSSNVDFDSDEEWNLGKPDGKRYVAAGAPFLVLEEDSPANDTAISDGKLGRKTVAKQSLVVKLSVNSESGLKLLKSTAEVDDARLSDGSGINGEDDLHSDDEADEENEDEWFDPAGAAGALSKQHQYVSALEEATAARIQATQHTGNIGSNGSNDYNGEYGEPAMAFGGSYFEDAIYHGNDFLPRNDFAQSSTEIDYGSGDFSYDNLFAASGTKNLHLQTTFAPAATFPDNFKGYHSAGLSTVDQTPSSGSGTYHPWSGIKAGPGKGIDDPDDSVAPWLKKDDGNYSSDLKGSVTTDYGHGAYPTHTQYP
jgi:hypothetical protein